jgi:hypothetical protein
MVWYLIKHRNKFAIVLSEKRRASGMDCRNFIRGRGLGLPVNTSTFRIPAGPSIPSVLWVLVTLSKAAKAY